MNFIFKEEIIDYDFTYSNSHSTILFLHGWGGNKFSFLSTINLLKNKHNILTITMPTNQPTKPKPNNPNYWTDVIPEINQQNQKS